MGIRIFTRLQELTGRIEVSFPISERGEKLRAVLDRFCDMLGPGVREVLFENNELRSYVHLLVDGKKANMDTVVFRRSKIWPFYPAEGSS